MVKNPPAISRGTGDTGSIPGAERSPGKGNGSPFPYSCLGNPMDREAWLELPCRQRLKIWRCYFAELRHFALAEYIVKRIVRQKAVIRICEIQGVYPLQRVCPYYSMLILSFKRKDKVSGALQKRSNCVVNLRQYHP